MKKVIIKLEDGKFIETFQRLRIVVTSEESNAKKYTEKTAKERIKKFKLENCELIFTK